MEALDLDSAGYPGTYKLIGGRVSLNFINTVSWPLTDRRHDWLSSVTNVHRWATAVDLDAHGIRPGEIDSIQATRATITDLLSPLAHGQQPAKPAIEEFNDMLSSSNARRSLDSTTLAWIWRDQTPQQTLLDPIIVDAADLASRRDRSRLRHCPACDWTFYDETRNGRRRWCDMADCGSRAKSRRYYERTKA